jgi:3-deoxy-D-manno-octulosonic-acid transferase
LLFGFYKIMGRLVHVLLVAALPVVRRLVPHWQLEQRLGVYPAVEQRNTTLIWIHAASTGEVQAARALINVLQEQESGYGFLLTTMTGQGREVALNQLPAAVQCHLAPLDTPRAVARAVRTIRPALYICLETELWPMLLTEISRSKIPMLLLNGRMSEQSLRSYLRIRTFMAGLLNGFTAVGVIQEQDQQRYSALGVRESRIRVCGNMKYDLRVENRQQVQDGYRQRLQLKGSEKVFITGSTRSGEEELLLPVFHRLQDEVDGNLLWIIAPRHLQRLSAVQSILAGDGLKYDLLSTCAAGERKENIVLVDSMGELAELYSVGEYNFCGGSLLDKGGHNIMEPLRWHKPVYFGSFMKDFRDAVELVLPMGAGFQVTDAAMLADCISSHIRHPDQYQQACSAAATLARMQQGAVQRQAAMVTQYI